MGLTLEENAALLKSNRFLNMPATNLLPDFDPMKHGCGDPYRFQFRIEAWNSCFHGLDKRNMNSFYLVYCNLLLVHLGSYNSCI